MQSVRIGYNLGSLLSMKQVLLFSKLADLSKDVDSLWVPESWGREAFSTLGAISQITNRVRIGTSVVSAFARTPATVAMAATTLDLLSDNRTIIGLGVSTEAIVEMWHGITFSKPLLRMREYVECLRQMITGQKVNYSGTFFNIQNFKLLYKPPRCIIPIFMAALNKKMISLSCAIADGVLLYLRPLEELKRTVAHIKSVTKNLDRQFEIACVFIGALSNREPEIARQRAAKTLAFYIAVGKYYNEFLSTNGYATEVHRITGEYRLNGLDAATKFVSAEMLDSLTISGDSEQCIQSIRRFYASGISLPIIQVNPVGDSETSFREMLTTFPSA
ncbi:MAG TPA: LLM class flavin-dependent oxidoreductase [Candidatus Nitrosopolaris sp.]|nr:LLM class flavin-dependent oxidoreductase [Candidatus Nitrosopolaris sp.]